MGSNENLILKTLLYSDIFNYPLKKQEIWTFLITEKVINKTSLFKNILSLNKFIEFKNDYFFIKGKSSSVKLREKREEISFEKLNKAKIIINKISFIPTLKFIGISGALSMKNSDKNDDIDIFVITKKGFVWTTRFLLILCLIVFKSYRYKNSKSFADKICLNMLVDQNKMMFKKHDQNLYTAHEIVQLIPVFDKENTYQKFIAKNSWVKNYLANFKTSKNFFKKKNSLFDNFCIIIFKIFFFEEVLKFIQLKYMQNGISKEVIREGFLAFHPFDYSQYVLKKYNQKIKKYKLF